LLQAGWSGDGIPVGGEIFHTHPAPYTMSTRSFLSVKWPGRDIHHPPPSSAEVKERVELYLYPPPLGLRGLFEGELANFFMTIQV